MTRPLSDNPRTARKRRYRDRLRRRVGVAGVEYDEDLIDTLVSLGHLTESGALDRREISRAMTAFVRAIAPAALASLNAKKMSTRPARQQSTVAEHRPGAAMKP